MTSTNNSRIAKNTAMLYLRMMFTMGISLYTSRVVLNVLGVENFGIYNVVGGFVTMFSFLSHAMASATQRFFSFEIGRQDYNQLRNVFSMSVKIHLLIAFIILLFAETIGLWFLNTQLVIPADRMNAARWVYQFSILTLIVNVINVPYNAIIIAHERMNVYAWISISEVSLKLLSVFILQWYGVDKLIFYAILIFSISVIIRLIYGLYCSRNFKEINVWGYWDKTLFKTLINYAAWNLWGNAAVAIMGQGVNVLLNIFFGPVINAARGIAYQVLGAVHGFVLNFQMAINPQIIKSFASNDLKYMHLLIFRGAKYSFFLLFALSVPIIFETEIILRLWLKNVPDYTVIFTRLVIVYILIESISGPLMTAAQASGRIKLYQGVDGGLLILNLPVSYIFLKLGYGPEITFIVSICISMVALYARLKIISPLVNLNIYSFMKSVLLKIIPVSFITIILPLCITCYLSESFWRLLLTSIISVLVLGLSIYLIGLERDEQTFVKSKFKQFFNYRSV